MQKEHVLAAGCELGSGSGDPGSELLAPQLLAVKDLPSLKLSFLSYKMLRIVVLNDIIHD